MKKKIFGWIVQTGRGFLIHEDENGKLWNAHRIVTVFKDIKKVKQIQRKSRKLALSNGKSYRLQIEIK